MIKKDYFFYGNLDYYTGGSGEYPKIIAKDLETSAKFVEIYISYRKNGKQDMREVTSNDQMIFELVEQYNLNFTDIAKILGISVERVRKAYFIKCIEYEIKPRKGRGTPLSDKDERFQTLIKQYRELKSALKTLQKEKDKGGPSLD